MAIFAQGVPVTLGRIFLAMSMLLMVACSGGSRSSHNHGGPITAQLNVQLPRYGPGQEFPFEARRFEFNFSGTQPAGSFWRVVFFNNSGLVRMSPTNLSQGEFNLFPPQAAGQMFAHAELLGLDSFGEIFSFQVKSNTVSFDVGTDYGLDLDIVSGTNGSLSTPGWSARTTVMLRGAFSGQDFDVLLFDAAQNPVSAPTPSGTLQSSGGELTLVPESFVLGVNYVQIVAAGLSGQPQTVVSPMFPVYRPTNPVGCTFGFNMWQGGGAISQLVTKIFHVPIPSGEFIGGGSFNYFPASWPGQPLSIPLGGQSLSFLTQDFPDIGVGEVAAIQMSVVMVCGPAGTTPLIFIPIRGI